MDIILNNFRSVEVCPRCFSFIGFAFKIVCCGGMDTTGKRGVVWHADGRWPGKLSLWPCLTRKALQGWMERRMYFFWDHGLLGRSVPNHRWATVEAGTGCVDQFSLQIHLWVDADRAKALKWNVNSMAGAKTSANIFARMYQMIVLL